MKKIRIVIVDDHKLIREMWRKLLSIKPEMEIVAESGAFEEAIDLIKQNHPDIVLLDINLADASGMDAVPLIRKFSPATRIIAVSMHNQLSFAKRMMALGAKGYVTKNSSQEEIFTAIDQVLNGKTYVCSEIKNILSEQVLSDGESMPKGIKDLSMREIEIIKYIKQGLLSKEIAAELHISIKTVEVHRHNILKKLNLRNVAALINYINSTDLNFH